MKLAYSSNAYRKFPITHAIERIAKIGYGAIEIMADQPHVWPGSVSDAQLENIRRALSVHDLQVSNVNAFMMTAVQDFWHPSWIEPDESLRRQRIQHTIDSLTLAANLGADSISTEPGGPLPLGMTRALAMDLFVAGLEEALDYAQRMDVMLLVEPEPELLIENADQFLELAERMTSPSFGLNFDIGHFYCVGDDLTETIGRLQRYTRHYHFEDIAANRVHEHLVPGRGAIDFNSTLRAIRDTGYDSWLTVELYPYMDDPDLAGRDAIALLEPLLS